VRAFWRLSPNRCGRPEREGAEVTMRRFVWTVIPLAALVAAVAAIGWTLPVSHVASRSATYPKAIEQVFAAVQAEFHESAARSDVRMEVAELQPPRRMVTRIVDADQPFGGTWTFDLVPDVGGGTRLTITERGEIYNVVFRFTARYLLGYTATIDGFLTALGQRLEREATSTAPTR
jgi:hypothetical protein